MSATEKLGLKSLTSCVCCQSRNTQSRLGQKARSLRKSHPTSSSLQQDKPGSGQHSGLYRVGRRLPSQWLYLGPWGPRPCPRPQAGLAIEPGAKQKCRAPCSKMTGDFKTVRAEQQTSIGSSSFLNISCHLRVQPAGHAVIASGEQQRDSAIHICVCPFSSIPHCHPGCHITLSRAPCAIQWVLAGYSFHMQQCVHVHPKLPNYPFPTSFPPAAINSFS